MYNIKYLLILFLVLYLIFSNIYIENFDNQINIPKFIKPNDWKNLDFQQKLKLYAKQLDKNYSFYVDKLLVKDLINNLNIKDLHVPKLIKVLNKNDDLKLDELPKNCIIKSNCGWGDIIFIKNREIKFMKARNKDLKSYEKWKKISLKPLNGSPILEPQYKFIKPKIFVEENLGDNIIDYKFFCIKGKIIFSQIDLNRFKQHCQNLYDKKFKILNYNHGYKKCNFKVEKPKMYDKMVEISEKLSEKFEFCRVDLYCINDKIYFGELTFTPDATKISFNSKKYNRMISDYWV